MTSWDMPALRNTRTAIRLTIQKRFPRCSAEVVNFLNGHNMQTAGIWTNESLDGNGTYSYATDAHYMGTKSLKMVKTNQTGWMTARQEVTLPKGQAYTLSAFFQTLADTVA